MADQRTAEQIEAERQEQARRQQEYNELTGQRSANEAQQQSTQSEIDALDDKIERLRAAYNIIDAEKETVKRKRTEVKSMSDFYEGSWKGAHATAIYTACNSGGDLYNDYTTYIDAVDAIEDAINNEICRLKNLKAEKYGILSGLIQAWNNLTTRIRNIFN